MHKFTPMHAGRVRNRDPDKRVDAECIRDQVLQFQQCLSNRNNRKVGHRVGEHTSCMSCQCLSAVIGSISSPVRSFVSRHGSHLLPFGLSVKPLIPSIHLPGPAALSPSKAPSPLFPSPRCLHNSMFSIHTHS